MLLAEAHTGAVPLTRSSTILPHFFVNINGRQGLTPVPVARVTPFHTQVVNNHEGNGRPSDLSRQKLTVLLTVTLFATLFGASDACESQIGLQRKTSLLQRLCDSPFLGGARTSLDNRNHDR
jgi:hypothetical protein